MNSGELVLGDEPFDSFIDGLFLAPEELAVARHAAIEVAAALRAVFFPASGDEHERNDHLVAGSVGKRTAIRPLPAVDLLYLAPGLAPEMRDRGVAHTLTRMEATLRAAFRSVAIIADGSRLLVAVNGLTVAVRPAEERHGTFVIPIGDSWVESNPAAEMAALRLSDSITGGRTTRMLALLKAWKAENKVDVPSFALEIMVREFMSEQTFISWADGMADFFTWARKRTPARFSVPGGSARLEVDDSWHSSAEAAYWRSVLARSHLGSGHRDKAIAEWQHLLGTRFGAPTGFSIWNIRPDMG